MQARVDEGKGNEGDDRGVEGRKEGGKGTSMLVVLSSEWLL